MKRIAPLVILAASCAGKYRAPPPVPSISLPSGAQLKPYDATRPGLARPSGMAEYAGQVYVALGNYDQGYTVRGPGMLAAIVPSVGQPVLIDLGGSDGKQCQSAGFVRAAGGKIYVTCSGDYNTGTGTAILEVDPAGAVSRRVSTSTSPVGVAVATDKIWFGDAFAGKAGAIKGDAQVGPVAVEMAETGDGRIAIVSGTDNKRRLVTLGTLAVEVGYTFSSTTATLQDVRARDQFLFTVASSSNTVQKIDLSAKGGPKLVAEANVGEGANPWNILPLDDDQAIVSNQMANTITAVSWKQVP